MHFCFLLFYGEIKTNNLYKVLVRSIVSKTCLLIVSASCHIFSDLLFYFKNLIMTNPIGILQSRTKYLEQDGVIQ